MTVLASVEYRAGSHLRAPHDAILDFIEQVERARAREQAVDELWKTSLSGFRGTTSNRISAALDGTRTCEPPGCRNRKKAGTTVRPFRKPL